MSCTAATNVHGRMSNWHFCLLHGSDGLVAQWHHREGATCFCWRIMPQNLSVVKRQSKHDIFKNRYQLGEFHHLYNELRKHPTKYFWVLQNIAFDIWIYSTGHMPVHFTQLNKFLRNNIHGRKTVCDTEVKSNMLQI